jgi:hypothetical protein
VSTRVTAAAGFVTQHGIAVTAAVRALSVSRQAVYDRTAPALRLLAPALPDQWQTMSPGPDHCDVETTIHVLARRHPAADCRKTTARARRAGYVLNRKKTARPLKTWGFLRTGRKPHPKAPGKLFDITASNQLWQTEMTSISFGEDGWGYFTPVIDNQPGTSKQLARHQCRVSVSNENLLGQSGCGSSTTLPGRFSSHQATQIKQRPWALHLAERVRHLRPGPRRELRLEDRLQHPAPACFTGRTHPRRSTSQSGATQISRLTVDHDRGHHGLAGDGIVKRPAIRP